MQESAGAYIFKPDWHTPLPVKYSKAREDVVHQRGKMLEQWTIMYEDGEDKAVIKVRFAPGIIKELIEFEVELNPISIAEKQGRDVTVNWSFLDGFDAKGTFWTDSNALEMQ